MGGGAWPFLVGGVICLVYSDNERNPNQLLRPSGLLVGTTYHKYGEELGDNRSVMLLDALGCTCATISLSTGACNESCGKSLNKFVSGIGNCNCLP